MVVRSTSRLPLSTLSLNSACTALPWDTCKTNVHHVNNVLCIDRSTPPPSIGFNTLPVPMRVCPLKPPVSTQPSASTMALTMRLATPAALRSIASSALKIRANLVLRTLNKWIQLTYSHLLTNKCCPQPTGLRVSSLIYYTPSWHLTHPGATLDQDWISAITNKPYWKSNLGHLKPRGLPLLFPPFNHPYWRGPTLNGYTCLQENPYKRSSSTPPPLW